MNGNQGLEALAALCGGEAAVATDKGKKSQPDSTTSRDGASGAAATSNNSTQPMQSVPEGITPQQWQQAVAAAAAFGSGAPTPAANPGAGAATGGFTAQSLALLQAAGLQAPPAPVQPTLPPNNDAAQFAATMQQLAYFRHLQEQQQQKNNAAAAATNVMNMNPLLYSNPQAMALALAGQAHQFQQHLNGTYLQRKDQRPLFY